MKRDFELIRHLLLFFEEKTGTAPVECPAIEGYSESMIREHLLLLNEAGLLRCEPVVSKEGRTIYVIPFELTWTGHEFLDRVRQESIWRKTKEAITSKGLSLGFEVVSSVASRLLLAQLE